MLRQLTIDVHTIARDNQFCEACYRSLRWLQAIAVPITSCELLHHDDSS